MMTSWPPSTRPVAHVGDRPQIVVDVFEDIHHQHRVEALLGERRFLCRRHPGQVECRSGDMGVTSKTMIQTLDVTVGAIGGPHQLAVQQLLGVVTDAGTDFENPLPEVGRDDVE